jgi:muramoyltetrapeptide carboxypeptidase
MNPLIMPFDTSQDISRQALRPPRLKTGDTIGIAAPAGPFETDLFERGMAVLKEMGFQVHVPEPVFKKCGFLAGPDEVRAEVINALFRDPEVDAVLCARGGYGSTRVLPYLDWETIRRRPKAFVGFSDITVLHWVLHQRTGLVSFHGPMGTTLAAASELSREHFQQALMSGRPLDLVPEGASALRQGEAVGKVVGGNLTLLCHLVGTPYAPNFDGCILVVEDVTEAPYRIDRMLVQLSLAGCFHEVAGVVLGAFQDCGDVAEIHEVFLRTFGPLGIPIVAGFPIGHGQENTTLPLGIGARLTTRPVRLLYDGAATT